MIALLPSAYADFELTVDGKPNATIVLDANPSDQAQEAAEQLQTYLARISGATLPIACDCDDVSGNRILVGRGETVDALGLAIPSGYTTDMNEEGFVVKTIGDDTLVLAGNEDWRYRGTIFAVYDFLEELGCHWYFPGEFGEVMPTHATIVAPELDRTERPDFRFRNIGYAGWMIIEEGREAQMSAWRDRHKVGGAFISMPGDGSIKRLIDTEEHFESNPEMFALDRHGNRDKDLLCMTNPDSRRISAQVIRDFFRDNPDVHSFGFAPADGHSRRCHCESCLSVLPGFGAKGFGTPSVSDTWFRFANYIATEVYSEFPDRRVLTNGYANRVMLPESIPNLSPNMGIQLATIHVCTFHKTGDPRCWSRQVYEKIFERWTDAVDCVIIYDYDPGTAVDNLPFPALHTLKHDLPYFKERGLFGFWTHAADSWMVTHLNYYVRAKLMWDTTEDVDALVREYCETFYGSAGKYVEDYIWTLERVVEESNFHTGWGDIIHWAYLLDPVSDKLDRLMAKAEAKATDPVYANRLRILRLYHDHMNAYLTMERAVMDLNFAEGAKRAQEMLDLRHTVSAIEPGMLPHTAEFAREFRTTTEWHKATYEDLAAKAGGAEGERILELPRTWQFQPDPKDMGVTFQWYLPDYQDGWEPIDTTRYWQLQGHADETGWGYSGKAWYRTQVDVPADAAGKPLTLTLGGVYYGELKDRYVWVWVNGRLLDWNAEAHRALPGYHALSPIHVDVTQDIRPGETNTIAVRVETDDPDRWPRGGLHRRSFIWSPRNGEQFEDGKQG
jgi:hypothetical protein